MCVMPKNGSPHRDDGEPSNDRITSFSSRRKFLGAGGLTLLGAAAGCIGDLGGDGGDGGDDAGDDSAADGDSEGTTGEANGEPEKPDSIIVRAWGGIWEGSLDESVAQPFTEDTGIEVQFDNTDRTEMQGSIRTAIQQGREPPVNVMWTVEPAAHEEYRMELADPIDPDIVDNVDQMFDLAIPNVEGSIPYLTLYSYTYALSYNEEALEEVHGSSEPVGAWADLKDPMYENAFGQYNNGYGFWPVLSAMADTPLDSDDLTPVYDQIRALEHSIGHIGDDTSLTQAVREGEIACAPLIMNNLYEANQEGEPVGWTIPEEGATVRGDSMYTPRNQSESDLYWSQVFINYAAAAENQSNWTESLGLPMLNSNTEPLDYMTDDPAYPTSEEDFENLLTVDLDVYAENSAEWFEEFSTILGV